MFLTRLKVPVVLLVLGLSALSCVVLARGKDEGAVRGDPAPAEKDRIQPGDRLRIRVPYTLPEQPIDGVFRVEPGGTVPLGPAYGRVQVKGQTPEEAEAAVRRSLSRVLKDPQVSVSRYDPVSEEGALERRVRRLEEEVRDLRAAVERLRKQKGG